MSIYVSLLTAGTNSHEETSENANAIATDFVSEGVIGAITNTSGVSPAAGAFAVNAQGTPDMTVAVSSGVAYVTGTPTSQNSQTLRVRMTASSNVTISSNTSGSTKYDWIYIKLDADKLANPAVNADDVATLVTSRSSSSTTDNGTPPTYGYCIGIVTVANSAPNIINANITDKRSLATSVQDKSIGSNSLDTSSGAFGPWTAFTPTFNLVGGGSWGNATFAGRSNQVGKTVRFWAKFTLGSTTNFAGLTGITLNLPVTASSSYPTPSRIGDTFMTNFYNGGAIISSTTVANIYVFGVSGTYLSPIEITSTVPHTWANTYFCVVSGEYEAA